MFNLLSNSEFIKWCFSGITNLTLVLTKNSDKLKPYVKEENLWWNKLIWQKNNNQWTTKLCEGAVEEILIKLWYKNITKARKLKSTYSWKKYNPDFECDNYVWEVKGRNRTTPWTAGEKILGTPLKYSEVPRLYWKPLRIVCVWYQEREAKHGFACWNLIHPEERWTDELRKILVLFKKLQIEYVWFTDLLKKLNM